MSRAWREINYGYKKRVTECQIKQFLVEKKCFSWFLAHSSAFYDSLGLQFTKRAGNDIN